MHESFSFLNDFPADQNTQSSPSVNKDLEDNGENDKEKENERERENEEKDGDSVTKKDISSATTLRDLIRLLVLEETIPDLPGVLLHSLF